MVELLPPSLRRMLDKGVPEYGMQMIARQKIEGSPFLNPVKSYLNGHPEASFVLAYMMPSHYGEPGATKAQTKQSLRRAGVRQLSSLYNIRPMSELPVATTLWNAYRNKDKDVADPEVIPEEVQLLEEDLQEVMKERQTLLDGNESITQTFNFLGLEDAEEFDTNIDGYIEQFIREHIATLPATKTPQGGEVAAQEAVLRFREQAAFTRAAYSMMDHTVRESAGEPVYFHPYRVTWYMLSYLKQYGHLPEDPEELNNLIAATMNHDIYEDLARTPDDPREGKAYADFTDDKADGSCSLALYNAEGDEQKRLRLSPYQKQTILALSSNDDRTYLQQSIKDDPSGWAAMGKMFDRLDNLLTYPPNASWEKIMAKIIESFTSMGQITLHARRGKDNVAKARDIATMHLRSTYPQDLPINVLTYGMFLNASSKIRERFLQHVEEKRGEDLRNYALSEEIRLRQAQDGGIRIEQIPDFIPLNRMVDHHISRSWRDWYEGKEASHNDLFSFTDIAPYLEEVADKFIYCKPVVLESNGCPEILWESRRKKSIALQNQ